MTDDKNRRSPPPEVEVLNPRYAGATPEMVARALLQTRPVRDEEDDDET